MHEIIVSYGRKLLYFELPKKFYELYWDNDPHLKYEYFANVEYLVNVLKRMILNNKLEEIQKLYLKEEPHNIIWDKLIKLTKGKLYIKYWKIGYEDPPIPEKYGNR